MNEYMIELARIHEEVYLYVEELKAYGEVTRYIERYPFEIWIESPWDKDILEQIVGVKKVREPIYRPKNKSIL